jgi:hypothetical protein
VIVRVEFGMRNWDIADMQYSALNGPSALASNSMLHSIIGGQQNAVSI